MEKVEGIDLAVAVEAAQKKRAEGALADHKERVNCVVNDLLTTMFHRNELIQNITKNMVESNAGYAKDIKAVEANLIIDEKRLAEIKAGNWLALDPEFGQPEKKPTSPYADIRIEYFNDTDAHIRNGYALGASLTSKANR